MHQGPLTGSYVRDVRVCVFDGKMHAVDSNDMAFKIAGMMAFKDAFQQARPAITGACIISGSILSRRTNRKYHGRPANAPRHGRRL